ncbi:class II aaRS and biotin synthetase [Myriangium duriaei CBS 260.36]|uniref:Class II aaRS and biotin synthetase n=1 Tax=Myriangium duriaei CBS 260.36 TaxID=1168546 RepID=A0A9P4IPP7_9PEZI|nr:class II aaRS and biotin synthetase [Myriangium duriaei CBS 260.36]
MSNQRLNVLVYTGTGATVESVKHCLWSLRRLLSPNYAVIPISSDAVLKEPWTSTCALFVMPGGADLGYCRMLNGEGNRRISQYVNKGGAYLGLCAGGYYGCSRCEFEDGKPGMAVVGDRELGFFPGTCRGLAYPGFVYHSEVGARASEVKVNKESLLSAGGIVPDVFRTYYNGGGVFVDALKFKDRGVEVLAEYTEKVSVDSGEGQAAVVYRRVGDGHVILTSPHPEFAAVNLGKGEENPDYPAIRAALGADDKPRVDFMKACLTKLGLKINQDSSSVPSLSRLHLSSLRSGDLSDTLQSLKGDITTENGEQLIKGENDTFLIEQDGSWGLSNIKAALPSVVQKAVDAVASFQTETEHSATEEETTAEEDKIVDYDSITKRIVIHSTSQPESKETPYFNHAAFFANLDHYNTAIKNRASTFGRTLLYGEVVTSTNTLLEKNPTLLSSLPTGLTATATTQLAGRGRGTNIWVSPPGSLMFSTVLRHPLSLSTTAPVVFVQYILALAIVSGIHSYDTGYARLPVRLKWPNDIYALDAAKLDGKRGAPTEPLSDRDRGLYSKIGGILISTSYTPSTPAYSLVCGAGVNVANAAPTTSLNQLAAYYGLPPFQLEKLLASILAQFEVLYTRFCAQGWEALRGRYESVWLHAGQVVTLDADVQSGERYVSGAGYTQPERCRVRGISGDWGLLVVEEVVGEEGRERPTGKTWELQADGNSFDFFKGLLKRKV